MNLVCFILFLVRFQWTMTFDLWHLDCTTMCYCCSIYIVNISHTYFPPSFRFKSKLILILVIIYAGHVTTDQWIEPQKYPMVQRYNHQSSSKQKADVNLNVCTPRLGGANETLLDISLTLPKPRKDTLKHQPLIEMRLSHCTPQYVFTFPLHSWWTGKADIIFKFDIGLYNCS